MRRRRERKTGGVLQGKSTKSWVLTFILIDTPPADVHVLIICVVLSYSTFSVHCTVLRFECCRTFSPTSDNRALCTEWTAGFRAVRRARWGRLSAVGFVRYVQRCVVKSTCNQFAMGVTLHTWCHSVPKWAPLNILCCMSVLCTQLGANIMSSFMASRIFWS